MNLQRTHPGRADGWDWHSALAAGRLASEAGDERRASVRFREAVRLAEEEHNVFGVVESLNSLGTSLARLENLPEAEALLRQAVATSRGSTLGGDAIGRSIGNLAEVVSRSGRAEEAAALFREVLALEPLESDPATRAAAHNNLGLLLAKQGHAEEAVTQFSKGIQLLDRGSSPVEWATIQSNLGQMLVDLGETDSGTARLEEGLAALRSAMGPAHPLTIKALSDLGRALGAAGRHSDGLTLQQEALTLAERVFGPDHPRTRELRADVEIV